MTRLDKFLTALYDEVADAELRALQHGHRRLAQLTDGDAGDVTVPVYRASNVEVTLDVALEPEESESGTDLYVRPSGADTETALQLTIDLFDVLDEGDLGKGPVLDRSEIDTKHSAHRTWSPQIDVISGLDKAEREALARDGISRVSDLVETPPERLAEVADTAPDRAVDWVDEARRLAAVVADREEDLPVELIDGIGPTFGRQLRDGDVADLPALADLDPETIAERASTPDVTVSTDRATRWKERAKSMLDALERLEASGADSDDAVNTDLDASEILNDRLGATDASTATGTESTDTSTPTSGDSKEKSGESTANSTPTSGDSANESTDSANESTDSVN
ncbi:MAG: helix-hairpin-helix domain-containing protein, partial [Halococcoides sp.]